MFNPRVSALMVEVQRYVYGGCEVLFPRPGSASFPPLEAQSLNPWTAKGSPATILYTDSLLKTEMPTSASF